MPNIEAKLFFEYHITPPATFSLITDSTIVVVAIVVLICFCFVLNLDDLGIRMWKYKNFSRMTEVERNFEKADLDVSKLRSDVTCCQCLYHSWCLQRECIQLHPKQCGMVPNNILFAIVCKNHRPNWKIKPTGRILAKVTVSILNPITMVWLHQTHVRDVRQSLLNTAKTPRLFKSYLYINDRYYCLKETCTSFSQRLGESIWSLGYYIVYRCNVIEGEISCQWQRAWEHEGQAWRGKQRAFITRRRHVSDKDFPIKFIWTPQHAVSDKIAVTSPDMSHHDLLFVPKYGR